MLGRIAKNGQRYWAAKKIKKTARAVPVHICLSRKHGKLRAFPFPAASACLSVSLASSASSASLASSGLWLGGSPPLARLEITLIRGKVACVTMREYAAKRNVDVATLRSFGQFL